MHELQRILQQYDDALSGEAWYGDPVWKILQGIDAPCAAAHPITGAHSIWQLVMHMSFWESVAVRRTSGPVVPDEKLNFPETPLANEADWQRTLSQFRDSNREFREALFRIDPANLDQCTPGGQRTFRWEWLGVIQHHIYHAGQIALLKRAFVGCATHPND